MEANEVICFTYKYTIPPEAAGTTLTNHAAAEDMEPGFIAPIAYTGTDEADVAVAAMSYFYSISGVASYDGYDANAPEPAPATITLYDMSNNVVATVETLRGEEFIIEDVPPGTYWLRASKKNHTYADMKNIVVTDSGLTIPGTLYLWAGDMDLTNGGKSNRIDGYDAALLLAYLGKTGEEAAPYDLNDDGVIDGADRLLQMSNYGTAGSERIMP
jgi:hypothetical protein